MATRKVLVKDLHGVETLGAITLLATDKTGTLTNNLMSPIGMWTGGKYFYIGSNECPLGQSNLQLDASGVVHSTHLINT